VTGAHESGTSLLHQKLDASFRNSGTRNFQNTTD